jgi:hypothetical protein
LGLAQLHQFIPRHQANGASIGALERLGLGGSGPDNDRLEPWQVVQAILEALHLTHVLAHSYCGSGVTALVLYLRGCVRGVDARGKPASEDRGHFGHMPVRGVEAKNVHAVACLEADKTRYQQTLAKENKQWAVSVKFVRKQKGGIRLLAGGKKAPELDEALGGLPNSVIVLCPGPRFPLLHGS